MSRKRFPEEEMLNKLCESDVLIARGQSIAQVCQQIGVTDQTYYRWRHPQEVRRLNTDQAQSAEGTGT